MTICLSNRITGNSEDYRMTCALYVNHLSRNFLYRRGWFAFTMRCEPLSHPEIEEKGLNCSRKVNLMHCRAINTSLPVRPNRMLPCQRLAVAYPGRFSHRPSPFQQREERSGATIYGRDRDRYGCARYRET